MTAELTAIITGMVFGLAGGLTPGPLLTLVISESLKHGKKEGIRVAMVPLITDIPIITAAVLILRHLTETEILIGSVALAGALFLSYLGYESVVFRGVDISGEKLKPQSVRKGIVANILNPNPYLFWITVGTPTLIHAYNASLTAAAGFLLAMYIFLVGSKVITAIIIGKSRSYLKSRTYIYAIRGLGVVLFIFAVKFFIDSLRAFGWI